MADKKDLDVDNNLSEPSTEDDLISSDSGYSGHRRRGWIMLVTYMLIALLFAVGVVLLGRWVYHRVHKTNSSTPQPAANTTKPQANNSSTSTQAPQNSNTQSPSNSSTSQVPNTGPGNVIALFAGTAIVVGGLHFIWSVRRA